jgi:hypothetical protein
MMEETSYNYCPLTGRRVHKSICAKELCEWVLITEDGQILCKNIAEVPTQKKRRVKTK